MKICLSRFNIILLSLICALAVSGCKTTEKNKTTEKDKAKAEAAKKNKKEKALMELYLAGPPTSGGRVVQLKNNAMKVSLDAAPFLDSRSIVGAQLLEDQFGFLLQIQFDAHGAFVLDTVTTTHRGKNIAVGIVKAGEPTLWIAAPSIQQRNASGYLSFTPDISREEAEKLVAGIQNVAKQVRKGSL